MVNEPLPSVGVLPPFSADGVFFIGAYFQFL